jgi:hypothetical protein
MKTLALLLLLLPALHGIACTWAIPLLLLLQACQVAAAVAALSPPWGQLSSRHAAGTLHSLQLQRP